ncbi:ferrochelatase [Campylobacter sp. FMV-PI01]|uniref:Ferrochelatase n=1 Tax=Campylobacter portucalensis TaxID=2608384 RepID=A0A6L5WKZ8_9BACT|nr:ferrochelatase [Campylobacter portucalensis]MSN97072.1 ferrochelatase [Campylobacter portucalensis]
MKKVILLLNMGGPNNLNEVEIFLKNMFNDPCILGIKNSILRKFMANLISCFRVNSAIKNYKAIGGKSPIVDITKSLVDKISKQFECDFIMRYTPPFAFDVLQKYKDYNEIILIPLYPHHSITTTVSSIEDIKFNLQKLGFKNRLKIVDVFYDNLYYNKIILNLIKEKVVNLTQDEILQTTLIFSAHSLPKKIVKNGDLYEKHIVEHFEILKDLLQKDGLNFKDIKLAYQSRLGPIEWLGPNLSDILPNIKPKRALIFPLSFCIDNSETDFELNIEYRHLASDFLYYEVCKCPNDLDEFAKFLILILH